MYNLGLVLYVKCMPISHTMHISTCSYVELQLWHVVDTVYSNNQITSVWVDRAGRHPVVGLRQEAILTGMSVCL